MTCALGASEVGPGACPLLHFVSVCFHMLFLGFQSDRQDPSPKSSLGFRNLGPKGNN